MSFATSPLWVTNCQQDDYRSRSQFWILLSSIPNELQINEWIFTTLYSRHSHPVNYNSFSDSRYRLCSQESAHTSHRAKKSWPEWTNISLFKRTTVILENEPNYLLIGIKKLIITYYYNSNTILFESNNQIKWTLKNLKYFRELSLSYSITETSFFT